MLAKVTLDQQEDMNWLTSVAQKTCTDGKINWGRVLTMLAFCAFVSQYLHEKGNEDYCITQVAQQISSYFVSHHHDWFARNNSWVSSERCSGLLSNDRRVCEFTDWLFFLFRMFWKGSLSPLTTRMMDTPA